jgi:phosphoserine aminotransferase
MNFVNLKPKKSMDYVVTGYWSDRAVAEAKKYGNVNLVLGENKKFTSN